MNKSKQKTIIIISIILVLLIGVGGIIMPQFHSCKNIFYVHSTEANYTNFQKGFYYHSDVRTFQSPEKYRQYFFYDIVIKIWSTGNRSDSKLTLKIPENLH